MIKRHHSDLQKVFAYTHMMYEDSYLDTIESLQAGDPDNLGLYMDEAMDMFAYCVVNDREKEETLKYLRQTRDFGVANFMYANHPGIEFSFVLEDNEYHFTGGTDGAYKNVSIWLKAVYMAIITRANNGVEELCKTSEEVFKNANIKPNEFDLAMVQVVKGLFDSEADIKYWILEASRLSYSDAIEPERQEYITKITAPTVDLYACILTRDEQRFNEELESALQMHQDFWSQSEKRRDNRAGWVSLPLLATCALAVDNKDFTITVESEYLPKWLYKKEF